MARVLTFSTKFPSWHTCAGNSTLFIEQFWASVLTRSSVADLYMLNPGKDPSDIEKVRGKIDYLGIEDFHSKNHTIRSGNRWKVGDLFSPRVWSDVPYYSPQIIIAKDQRVEKTWKFEVRRKKNGELLYLLQNRKLSEGQLITIAHNDGLHIVDFKEWFNKPFKGQVICWNKEINY